jgi:hypothetical protein
MLKTYKYRLYPNKEQTQKLEETGKGLSRIKQQAEWLYDHFVDHVIYAIHAREWQNLRQMEKGRI